MQKHARFQILVTGHQSSGPRVEKIYVTSRHPKGYRGKGFPVELDSRGGANVSSCHLVQIAGFRDHPEAGANVASCHLARFNESGTILGPGANVSSCRFGQFTRFRDDSRAGANVAGCHLGQLHELGTIQGPVPG